MENFVERPEDEVQAERDILCCAVGDAAPFEDRPVIDRESRWGFERGDIHDEKVFKRIDFPLDSFRRAPGARSRTHTSTPHPPTTLTAERIETPVSAETIRRSLIAAPRSSSSVEKRRDTQGHDDE